MTALGGKSAAARPDEDQAKRIRRARSLTTGRDSGGGRAPVMMAGGC